MPPSIGRGSAAGEGEVGDDVAARAGRDARLGVPRESQCREMEVPKEDLEEASRLASDPPPWNPRPVSRSDVLQILEDAFEGRRPRPQAGGPEGG